jgi:hypothetical protein
MDFVVETRLELAFRHKKFDEHLYQLMAVSLWQL